MATSIVPELLNKKNYKNWRSCMKSYLKSQDLWKAVEVDEVIFPPSLTIEEIRVLERIDAAALHAIKISCSSDILEKIRDEPCAMDAWNSLAAMNNWKPPQGPKPEEESEGVDRYNALSLFKAIASGDLDLIRNMLEDLPNLLSAKLFEDDAINALHIAVSCNQLKVVQELVSRMSSNEELIKTKNMEEWEMLPLGFAAYAGGIEMMKIVDCLIGENEKFVKDFPGLTLLLACLGGDKDMFSHLYRKLGNFTLPDEDAANILTVVINRKWFDLAFDLIRRFKRLNSKKVIFEGMKSLMAEPKPFRSATRLLFWQQWIYSCLPVNLPEYYALNHALSEDVGISIDDQKQNEKKDIIMQEQFGGWSILLKLLGIKQIYDLKVRHVCAQKLLHFVSTKMAFFDIERIRDHELHKFILKSAEFGVPEVIVEIVGVNPDLLWCTDDDGRNIFHIAIIYRQEKVFNLIHGIGTLKHQATLKQVLNKNEVKSFMLHLAGESPPQRLIDQIQGPALLMQRELQWFQEVENVVPWSLRELRNDDGKDAYKIFEESHKELVKQGEEWMKGIAQSSTVVGTLIITMMFAALYTVPGGNNQDGIPLFLQRKVFELFIMSDTISLSASTTSVLMFLNILTARYAAKDFLKSLPTKLIIALLSLFISITTMMIAFCSAVFIVLKGQLSFFIPIVFLLSIPVYVFVRSQFPLLFTILRSTYGPGIFDRETKKWL